MSETARRAVGVSVSTLAKDFSGKRALDGVSIDVDPGTFLVLLGPSGSGKTTLLRCVAGIERPSSGTISIGGNLVVAVRQRRRIQYDHLRFPSSCKTMQFNF